VLLVLNQPKQAEAALLSALAIEPQNQDYFIALVDLYLKTGRTERARALAINIIRQFPDHNGARELLQYMK
jgi:predicted Zn-dependent protease